MVAVVETVTVAAAMEAAVRATVAVVREAVVMANRTCTLKSRKNVKWRYGRPC